MEKRKSSGFIKGFFSGNKQKNASAKRNYEGASKTKKLSNWLTPSTSAQAEVEKGHKTLRDRVRSLVRNDPLASRAVSVIQVNTVGKGIKPQFQSQNQPLKQRIEKQWNRWAETLRADFQKKNSFYSIQGLAIRALAESGECLILKKIGRSGGLELLVIEADHLDESRDTIIRAGTTLPDKRIRNGIEFDEFNRVIAYHIYDHHPGDSDSININSTKYDAEDVIHLFRVDRPGQIRGVPWGAPAIIKMKDLSDYEFAELQRQKIATCFAAFIKRNSAEDQDEEEADELGDTISPGMISKLGFDEDITFSDPPQPTDASGSFRFAMERRIAAAWGVPVDSISADLSRVNFSSGRMGRLDFYRNVDVWQNDILIPRLNDEVMEWWLDSLILKGELTERQRSSLSYTWVTPERAFVDPAKEFKAIAQQIDMGVMSKSEAIRMRGKDPEEVMQQISADKGKEELLDISNNQDRSSLWLSDPLEVAEN